MVPEHKGAFSGRAIDWSYGLLPLLHGACQNQFLDSLGLFSRAIVLEIVFYTEATRRLGVLSSFLSSQGEPISYVRGLLLNSTKVETSGLYEVVCFNPTQLFVKTTKQVFYPFCTSRNREINWEDTMLQFHSNHHQSSYFTFFLGELSGVAKRKEVAFSRCTRTSKSLVGKSWTNDRTNISISSSICTPYICLRAKISSL